MSDKESVFVYVPCGPFGVMPNEKTVYRGPNTHCRSEGYWMLAVALNMARHGHQVTIGEYPWGNAIDYPIPENVSFQPNSGNNAYSGKYDIYISMGWEDTYAPLRCKNIDAHIYVHGWGGNPRGSTFLDYAKKHNLKNHYLANAPGTRCFYNLFRTFDYGIYMPYPVVSKIQEKGNFHSRKTLWGNRGAFNPGYKFKSLKLLDFMEKYPDYLHTVLLYDDIKQRCLFEKNFYGDGIGGKEGAWIVNRFEHLPNKRLLDTYQGLPHDEFLRELNQSKLLLANGQPACHPQTVDAICMGAIPVIWNDGDNHFKHIPKDDSVYDINQLDERDKNYRYVNVEFGINGTDGLDNIMNDEDLYQKYYTALREVSLDHEYDTAYDIFMSEIRKKEEKL